MGKKQVSQMNLYDYIIGITIGSVVADISLDIEKNFLFGVIALLIFCLSETLISYLTNKSISLRRFINGVPTVLIENNKIIESGLSKSKIDVNDLLSEARVNGYFNIEEIEYAIMETNGKISFLPKEKEKPVSKKDMNLNPKNEGLTTNLIIDETLLENNLKTIKKTKKWLMQQLQIQGFNSFKGILLATFDTNQKLIIYKKNNKTEKHTELE